MKKRKLIWMWIFSIIGMICTVAGLFALLDTKGKNYYSHKMIWNDKEDS